MIVPHGGVGAVCTHATHAGAGQRQFVLMQLMHALMHALMHTLMQLARSLSAWEPLPDQLPNGLTCDNSEP